MDANPGFVEFTARTLACCPIIATLWFFVFRYKGRKVVGRGGVRVVVRVVRRIE